MERFEALLAVVDWGGVDGGRLGDHIGPVPAVPQMVRDLWHVDPDQRFLAIDFLERTGLTCGQPRPATVQLVPVIVAVLADARSAGVRVSGFFDPRLPLRARRLEMLGNAATAPAWGGTDEELRAKRLPSRRASRGCCCRALLADRDGGAGGS
ncbi:hypothetical protein ACQEVZ_50465 [Dactylosporangium sp. CA-152071]|uniref:hypothetical protein n=1 Tax=Dactylosporangium sp. CA-152071 TaxID=3239933 RepID=UPI003D8F9EFF